MQKILKLVEELKTAGWEGIARYETGDFPSGVSEELENRQVMSLSGFCKEHLYLYEDEGDVFAYGRYSFIGRFNEITVKDVTEIALRKAKLYHSKSYPIPLEFINLFLHFGMIEEVKAYVFSEKYDD